MPAGLNPPTKGDEFLIQFRGSLTVKNDTLSSQIVECFPNIMPKDLPDLLQKTKWTKPAKEVENWDQWYVLE